MKRLKNSQSEHEADEQIKENILSILAGRLRELTSAFKSNEKEHFLKLKEFHGDDCSVPLDDKFFEQ